MKLKIYQIDAFADKVFSGNPAAVCPLEYWLSDDILQNIARENNMAATAFYVKQRNYYEIRWFTPTVELNLCGHGTLAAAYVLFNYENHNKNSIEFNSFKSGSLIATKIEELIVLNFPAINVKEIEMSEQIISGFDIKPKFAYKSESEYLLVFANEEEIKRVRPVFETISQLEGRGVIITAVGNEVDFVSRFFAPQININEDLATGSIHTLLIPYWAKYLGKNSLTAKQLSSRKGHFYCKYLNESVEIGGQGKLYLEGNIFLS
ncbi:PhzF family phenazine biosynthesis protein [Zunongwangia pacifica]|uniref:PhzF family phenazine biosynthesis protein n=1 Tax=Zunongwangia pacifica TaxID=2911062 RepID=A0A9X2CM94_9FLAO|nr:PhzF family phenazine biosynthesis protein [Zunongwangia pacifica]MCL6220906.1 PhzF family phenazine biosynthesis protein [Zunongwangia pacifica]